MLLLYLIHMKTVKPSHCFILSLTAFLFTDGCNPPAPVMTGGSNLPTPVIRNYDGPIQPSDSVSIFKVHKGSDNDAEVISLDGKPIASYTQSLPKNAELFFSILPGRHSAQIVAPGLPEYRNGPRPRIATLQFTTECGKFYKASIIGIPSQIGSSITLAVYEVIKEPYVFKQISSEYYFIPFGEHDTSYSDKEQRFSKFYNNNNNKDFDSAQVDTQVIIKTKKN